MSFNITSVPMFARKKYLLNGLQVASVTSCANSKTSKIMYKWIERASDALLEAIEKAEKGGIPTANLYMLAPIIYSEKHAMNSESLIQEMIEINDKQFSIDCSHDENSQYQYKFHFVFSYLNCFVVAGKFDEFKHDQIMEAVCRELDLFESGYSCE